MKVSSWVKIKNIELRGKNNKMNKKLFRNCPICNCESGQIIHSQSFILEQNNPLPNSYDVVSCLQCGFCFADTDASQKDYNDYYQNFSKYENIETYSEGGGKNDYKRQQILSCVMNA